MWMRLVGFLSLGCAVGCAGASEPPAPRAPHRLEHALANARHEVPEVERHFEGMSEQAVLGAGAALILRGLPRMSDDELHRYATLRAEVLASSDAACEAMVASGAEAESSTAFDALDDERLRAWARLTTHAQALELAGGARPMPADQALEVASDALGRIEAHLSASDLRRWRTALGSTTPADACFSERIVMREAAAMPAAEAGATLRALLEASVPPT